MTQPGIKPQYPGPLANIQPIMQWAGMKALFSTIIESVLQLFFYYDCFSIE